MSDLVLGLLVLGMLLFAGVLLYNRWQERAAQRAFGSSHPDALLAAETSAARHEPTLHKAEPPRVALPDRRFSELNVAVPTKTKGLRSERRRGRLMFFVLLLTLSGLVYWLYYTVTHP